MYVSTHLILATFLKRKWQSSIYIQFLVYGYFQPDIYFYCNAVMYEFLFFQVSCPILCHWILLLT